MEFYAAPWFLAVRRHVEAAGDPWFILSAKYGLAKRQLDKSSTGPTGRVSVAILRWRLQRELRDAT
jgi:uncharacterized protein DUF6884